MDLNFHGWKLALLGLLLLLSGVGIGVLSSDAMVPLPWAGLFAAPPAQRLEVAPCNLADGPCQAQLDDQSLRLGLGVDLRPMRIFPVDLRLPSNLADAKAVQLRFDMQSMAMPPLPFPLREIRPGHWQGTALLPLCVTGRQDWLAVLEIDADHAYRAEFSLTMSD